MYIHSIWMVLGFFGFVAMNDAEYDVNCVENYDNEIPLDQQQESPSLVPCQDDAPRWDKLFMALEDSHMRQNMLLSSVDQNCGGGGGGTAALKTLWDKLTKGGCHICASNIEKLCRSLAEQTDFKMHQEFVEMKSYNIEMETNFNSTLQQILHQIQETNLSLKRLEDDPKMPARPTPVTEVYRSAATMSYSGLKEGSVGRALVAIATELQKVQLQLEEVIKEARNQGRGDT